MTPKLECKTIEQHIIDVVSNRLSLITRSNLSQIMLHDGYTETQYDMAIKRLKKAGLIRIGVRNVPKLQCTISRMPLGKLSEDFIKHISDAARRIDGAETQPSPFVSATMKLAGLVGKEAVGDLSHELFCCHLRLSNAFTNLNNDCVTNMHTWETQWPKRNSVARVAYARFKPTDRELIYVAAALPRTYQEAERWLVSLKKSGRNYVIC